MLDAHRSFFERDWMTEQGSLARARVVVLDEISVSQQMSAVEGIKHVEHRRACDVVCLEDFQDLGIGTCAEQLFCMPFHALKALSRRFRPDCVLGRAWLEARIAKAKCRVHPELLP